MNILRINFFNEMAVSSDDSLSTGPEPLEGLYMVSLPRDSITSVIFQMGYAFFTLLSVFFNVFRAHNLFPGMFGAKSRD